MVIDASFVKRHIKPKADSTLLNMKKADLIDYVRTLEHNYNVAVSFNEQQARNIEAMIKNGDIPQHWMPASEPPKEPMEYIVMIKGSANSTTLLFDGRLWFEEDPEGWRTYYEVTHWMPMPEKPDTACRHLSVSLEADSSPRGEPLGGRIAASLCSSQ
jgi:hypothetical protein